MEITLEKIEAYLGPAIKHRGDEYQWQCPYCLDKHMDNLKFNKSKGVLWCFASAGEHSKQILKAMYKNNPLEPYNKSLTNSIKLDKNKSEDKVAVYTYDKQQEFLQYLTTCNESLLNNKELLERFLNIRGINENTVMECGIGFDSSKNCFVLPTFQYSTNINNYLIGFEYRPSDFSKKITRSKGTPTAMAMINCFTPKTEVLAIVEGYMDGYALLQYLIEKKQDKFYHVITPCNGISGLNTHIKEIEFSKYKACYLYVDNDEAGNNAANELLQKYSFLKRISMDCGCKDFNEHYLKCIKKIQTK